jgi:hypothetical protein
MLFLLRNIKLLTIGCCNDYKTLAQIAVKILMLNLVWDKNCNVQDLLQKNLIIFLKKEKTPQFLEVSDLVFITFPVLS